MAEIIKSKDNPLIKRITRLLSSAKGRREEGCFVCEGVRLCRDAVLSGAGILCFCCTEQAYSKNVEAAEMISSAAEKTVRVSPSLLSKLSDTDNPQGFLCIVRMNARAAEITPGRCYAALERIQDPSNLGTILRTAEALGISGVILSGDCCDIYSPKVVRGSMGAVFRLPFIIKGDFTEYIRSVSDDNIRTFASTPRNAVSIEKADFSAGGIMLIGNEGSGLCEETIDACTDRVMIPMLGRAESLNASSAASILLYKLISSQKLG